MSARRRFDRWPGLAAAILLLLPSLAAPCSICRCGDPTFNALGKDGLTAQGWRFAFDWERFDKTEGDPAASSEAQVENRLTLHASYGLSERVTLLARVPVSSRRLVSSTISEGPDVVHTSGLSDPELYAQARLWSSPFNPKVGRRVNVLLVAGVKTPWGQNDVVRGGVRVDEHAQPGTGSTDPFGSLALLYLVDRRSAVFASLSYRHTGTNDFGYRYGSSLLGNLAYEHKLSTRIDGALELNYRSTARDVVDPSGARNPDTGGSLLYLTPRLLLDLGRGVVFRVAAQIPIHRDLNGFQQERAVLNGGLTYLFSRH